MKIIRTIYHKLSLLILFAVLTAGVFATFNTSTAKAASSLILQNPILIFQNPEAVSFTVSGAIENVQWTVKDSKGQSISSGSQAPNNDTATIAIGQKIPTGYYTFSFSSPSNDEITAAFGVTGPTPSKNPYFSAQTLSAHSGSVYRNNMDRIIPMLKNLGFSSRRDSVYWNEYELTPGNYATPPSIQQILDYDQQNDMDLFWTAGSGNSNYDSGNLPSSPTGIQAYAKYIDDFLTQHPRVKIVEMLNEFNGANNSACGATAACYIEIAKVVYPYVKSRHPDVTIVAGGLAAVSLSWWQDFFSAGGATYGDAFSYHPYNLATYRINETADEVTNMIKQNNNGVGKPLYLSEIGWSITNSTTGNPAKVLTEAQQADRLIYSFVAPQASPQIAGVNWYHALNYGSTDTEYNFGLFQRSTANIIGYQPKQSAIAFYVMRAQLDGYTYTRTDALANNINSYIFTNAKGDTVQALWRTDTFNSMDPATTPITIPTNGRKYTSVMNVNGERIALYDTNATSINENLSLSPLFVTTTNSLGATNPPSDGNSDAPGMPNTGLNAYLFNLAIPFAVAGAGILMVIGFVKVRRHLKR